MESVSWRDTRIPKFIAALFTIFKILNQSLSVEKWMEKENVIHTPTMDCYSLTKHEEILSFPILWMNLEGSMLNEINQAQKDEFCMVWLRCRLKKVKLVQRVEWWFPGAGRGGKGGCCSKSTSAVVRWVSLELGCTACWRWWLVLHRILEIG